MPMSGGTGRSTGGVLSITYSSSDFCTNATDPIPTVTNNVGAGTFSSTTGLVFVSTTTGEVDISNTVTGTYVITYTDTDAATATFSLTLNALDNAAFSYSANSFEPTDADPTPTITGLKGGTFSGTTGLVINSTTGEIDLSASTEASHTVTYNTSTSGSSVCPNTSTFAVTIAVAGISNVYSMSFDGSNDYIDANKTIQSNLDFSVSIWINPNASDLQILGTREQATGASSSKGFILQTNSSNQIRARLFTTTSTITQVNGGTVSTGVWSQIAITYVSSSKVLKIYVNGAEVGSVTGTATPVLSPDNLNIGRAGVGGLYHYFNGSIDEVGIWNTALTTSQIEQIYNATSTGKTADLSTISSNNLKYWNRLGD